MEVQFAWNISFQDGMSSMMGCHQWQSKEVIVQRIHNNISNIVCTVYNKWQPYIYFMWDRGQMFKCQQKHLKCWTYITSDSSMFDGRETVDRLDNPGQPAVYWARAAATNLTQYFCQNSLYNLYHSIHLEPHRPGPLPHGSTTRVFQQDP